jgi:hypothetical protein
MRIAYFIPGGFVSFLIAFFIRLWAIDHGHLFLAKLAFAYMIILLIPFAVFLLVLLAVGLVFLFMFIFMRRRRL